MGREILWAILHPGKALQARIRQVEVSIEHAQPPVDSTFEDFPNLSVKEAARLIKNQGSGVPLKAWPLRDQKLMLEGKMPFLGDHPEHPNV